MDNSYIVEFPENEDMQTMSLNSKKGTKVKFTGIGGWDFDKNFARKHLSVGGNYTISKIRVSGWYSYVTLEEFPDLEFNTVMFDKV